MTIPKKPPLLANPLYSPALGETLPTHPLVGPSDDQVRAAWEAQRTASYVPGTPRFVRIEGGSVLHPDDLAAGMTRVRAYRPRRRSK
jgi:hypothetical protein